MFSHKITVLKEHFPRIIWVDPQLSGAENRESYVIRMRHKACFQLQESWDVECHSEHCYWQNIPYFGDSRTPVAEKI